MIGMNIGWLVVVIVWIVLCVVVEMIWIVWFLFGVSVNGGVVGCLIGVVLIVVRLEFCLVCVVSSEICMWILLVVVLLVLVIVSLYFVVVLSMFRFVWSGCNFSVRCGCVLGRMGGVEVLWGLRNLGVDVVVMMVGLVIG